MVMKRYLSDFVKEDSDKKIILISGPRQSGKTTLTKDLFEDSVYFNYDLPKNREAILKRQWRRDAEAILFDELHKMPAWKRWIKSLYDVEGNRPRIIVTGSANMETYRKVGDSLAGRYFRFRMHPIDLKEGCTYWENDPIEVFSRLMQVSGFPEPFLEGKEKFYKRWQKSHLDIMLRQDFLDMYAIKSIKSVEVLMDLLKPRVASPVSYQNLAEDLQISAVTIKSWMEMLENSYAIFRVTPYHKNIARSLLKEPKFYFFDIPRVPDEGARLENLVACALLKEINYLEDTQGYKGGLHYLKTKDGVEIDFLVALDDKPILCVEVKSSDDTPSKNFKKFRKFIGDIPCVQLVLHLDREFDTPDKIQVRRLIDYLTQLDLEKLLK